MFKSLTKKINQYRKYSKNIKHYQQLEEYLNNKILLPSLHIVKQNNIHEYRKRYKLETLVETGTFMGDMVAAQKEHFKFVYSIELSKELHFNAAERFKNDENVKIVQGDSAIVIKDILSELKEPALFWLDGHYSAGVTAKADKDTPILLELEHILSHKHPHIILIDDARLFIGENDYPTIPELCEFVLSRSPSKKISVADDIIRILPS